MFGTILVPLDGSAVAERALPYAEALAVSGGARLILVQAVQTHTLPGVDATTAQVEAIETAEGYLEEIAARLSAQGVMVDTAVPYGPAAEAIADDIELRKADAVVMTTHGRGGLSRLLFGSVANGALRQCPAPLLLVRPAELQAAMVRPLIVAAARA